MRNPNSLRTRYEQALNAPAEVRAVVSPAANSALDPVRQQDPLAGNGCPAAWRHRPQGRAAVAATLPAIKPSHQSRKRRPSDAFVVTADLPGQQPEANPLSAVRAQAFRKDRPGKVKRVPPRQRIG
jgi:hypothetical protein